MNSKTVAELTNDDYPAAHSMDTAWFAVDENGNLAEFHAGDEGSVPVEWLENKGEGKEVWEAWRTRTPPFDQIDCKQAYWFGGDDDCKCGTYRRINVPLKPLRTNDISPPALEALQPVVLDSIQFDRMLWIQPVEFLPCHTYCGFALERKEQNQRGKQSHNRQRCQKLQESFAKPFFAFGCN